MKTSVSAGDGVKWFAFRPDFDLVAVAVSYALVVAGLAVATFVVTAKNGVGYFLVYGLGVGLVLGIGVPLWWTVIKKRRPVSDLGITTRRLGLSIALQAVFAGMLYWQTLRTTTLPALSAWAPLVALALAIGFFEAVFWRGWVLLRLEESFGIIPAVILGSALYAFYHVGYGMAGGEMLFLFWIGVLYAVTFRITRNVFLLWPLFQPMGQLVTLLKDGLDLPLIAVLGFGEVLAAMLALVFFAHRFQKKRAASSAAIAESAAAE